MIDRPRVIVAQSDPSTGGALLWSLVLIVALVLLFGAVVVYRKWMNADDTTTGEGFTLSDLRKLHREGKMTTEEFEKAKMILIGSVQAAAAKEAADKAAKGPRTNPSDWDVPGSGQ